MFYYLNLSGIVLRILQIIMHRNMKFYFLLFKSVILPMYTMQYDDIHNAQNVVRQNTTASWHLHLVMMMSVDEIYVAWSSVRSLMPNRALFTRASGTTTLLRPAHTSRLHVPHKLTCLRYVNVPLPDLQRLRHVTTLLQKWDCNAH